VRILMIGDVVGRPGRHLLGERLPALRRELGIAFTIANGENMAGGLGVTRKTVQEVMSAGVDVITSGNHIWDQKEAITYITEEPNLLRPANYPEGTPGRGWCVVTSNGMPPLVVINVHGRVFVDTAFSCPFRTVERILSELGERDEAPAVIVDFHGEATSEKQAFGLYFDGRVAAVIGTHTHVQTADARILPRGTAYVTDVGMTGPAEGVIGMDREPVIQRFLTQMPARFNVARGASMLNAAVIDVDTTGDRPRAERIELYNQRFE